MIGKIMFMREMIVMKLNEEEAEEFIGGFTLQFTVVVVVFMMNYEMLFVKHQAMIVVQDFTGISRGAGYRFFFGLFATMVLFNFFMQSCL